MHFCELDQTCNLFITTGINIQTNVYTVILRRISESYVELRKNYPDNFIYL